MLDREAMYSYKQAVAASGESEDVVFVGKGDAGPGQPIGVEITTPAVTGGGSVTVAIQHSDTAGGTYATIQSEVIAADALARGGAVKTFYFPDGLKDWTRLHFTLTGTVTGFVATAGLVWAGQTNRMR